MTDQLANKEIIKQYLAHLEARDAAAAATLIADDATWWYVDRGFLKKENIQATHARILELTNAMTFSITGQIAEGAWVATEMHVLYKTKDGRDLDNDVHMSARIKDGKLQEVREYYNMSRPPLSLK
jgi:ketosteroid isomerase-like protein